MTTPASSDSAPQGPRLGVGAVVFRNNAVLLVKRNRPPAVGEWAIPGGKVRWGETLREAAERELMEETHVRARANEVVFTFELLQHNDSDACHTHYVIVDLAADYLSGEPRAGDDAADARWVSEEELATLAVNATTRQLLREVYGFGNKL